MIKYFNTEGSCKPKEHYMVKLDDRLEMTKNLLINRKKYFVINRGRQYGKTTTLRGLEEYLQNDYIVLSVDFQEIPTDGFANGITFSNIFTKILSKAFGFTKAADKEKMQKLLTDFRQNN